MPRLRIMSWNLRTFAARLPPAPTIRGFTDIVVNSKADVVCLQEIQIGENVALQIGAPISQASVNSVNMLLNALIVTDPGGAWRCAVTGANSGSQTHMRDAYAFLWKQQPVNSNCAHAEPPNQIDVLSEAVILRQVPKDNFPGRRPGMLPLNVRAGATTVPLNIVSYHAQTPVNKFSKDDDGAGYGIDNLATLPEVGGGRWYSTGWTKTFKDNVTPLPQIDTVVLGDFNCSMGFSAPVNDAYHNLLTNYQGCISTLNNIVKTTYGASPADALRLVSAYDNIFALRPRATFTPALTFASADCIDFIQLAAKQLGDALKIQFGTEAAWYVVYLDQYKKQHATDGLSDHLPVWAEFTIGAGNAAAQRILPTSQANNNSLLHAVYGAPDAQTGRYIDAHAGAKRAVIANALSGYLAQKAIPANVRAPILSSMLVEWANDALAVSQLKNLQQQVNSDPFQAENGFADAFTSYITDLKSGRVWYEPEAELLALLDDIPLTVHYVQGGQYAAKVVNPNGKKPAVHVYRQSLRFFRWQP